MVSIFSNNSEEFLNESKSKIESDYLEFQGYQKKALEILSQIHIICEKYQINYYLAYGSMLGAVRDNGQIPWDYDIDIWVPLEDSNKLFSALDNELPETFFYECRLKDPLCYHNHMRISPKGYSSEILHVDVFWLTGAGSDEQNNLKHLQKNKLYYKYYIYKHIERKYIEGERKSDKFFYKYYSLIARFIPDSLVDKTYLRNSKLKMFDCKYVTDNAHMTNMESKWFKERKLLALASGLSLYIPAGYEEILKMRYGDYKRYMDIDVRMKEMLTSLKRIRKLGKVEEDK